MERCFLWLWFKISVPTWNKKSELPNGSYQTFKIISSLSSKKHGKVTVNPPIRIYVNKIENRITFKIKSEYYLEL